MKVEGRCKANYVVYVKGKMSQALHRDAEKMQMCAY